MSHIKTAALLDKAFRFLETAKGTTRKRIGSELYDNRISKSKVLKAKAQALKNKAGKSVMKNLDTGVKQHDSRYSTLNKRYDIASRATTKARAYLLGGGVAAGAVGVGAAVHYKNKKDRALAENISKQTREDEGYNG